MQQLQTSQRAQNIIASPIRKFLPLVKKAESRGVKFIKLNIGDPNILPPENFIKGLKQIKSNDLYYAASSGVVKYVKAWLKYFASFKVRLDTKNIIPTMGASEAIVFALQSVCDISDEVLVFEPFYTNYKALSQTCGIKLVPVTLKMDNCYQLPDVKTIEQKITDKTKAIIVINPDNPTGKVWHKNELNEIIKLALKYNLFIIADETYREMVFAGWSNFCLLKNQKIKNNLIVIDSISKRLSMPGIRMGVVVSYNQEVIEAILKLAMARLAVSTVGQLVTAKIISNNKKYIQKITQEYQERIDILNKALLEIPGVETCRANGAFYQVIKLPIKNSEDFIKFLITKFCYKKTSILLAPMSDFYITPGLGNNEVRIALVTSKTELKQAMKILKLALKAYKKIDNNL